jgi:tetratricopeptide (TPR) repeat protein
VKGSPFRGLAAFGARHSPVFFGRGSDTARAVELWIEAGRRGAPYLLLMGASGAGKSSLARAGLLPRLTTPGVVAEVDLWRVAVVRPGDAHEGPFAALAAALMQCAADLPKNEAGRGPALPEIAQGDSATPVDLAALLRHVDAAAVKPIMNALTRIGAAERERERYGRDVRCDLVLLIDQFEELFAGSVTPDERTRFVGLMAALVRTGRVWVVTTLRADFYQPMLAEPMLKDLKEAGANYDVAPPGAVELAEIVCAPAQAAGLVFEHDPATGERLDARILRDTERPDMLPLVQLVLSRLFDARKSDGGEVVLSFAAYTALGGLKGIVDEAGEKALALLGDAERALLPRLLRQLAVPTRDRDGTDWRALTIRAVPLAQAAADAVARRLVDALVAARLLTISGAEADAQVRLTHQRVLEDWRRAHALVAESEEFYRIRAEVEDARRRWQNGGRRRELLLARGLPLAEGESIAGRYGDELAPETLAYVRASRRSANRLQMLVRGAAVMFALLAVAASGAAWLARQNELRASRNLALAIDQSDSLVAKIGDELQNSIGVSKDAIRQILQVLEGELDQVGRIDPGNERLALSRVAMLVVVAENYVELGEFTTAADRARQCVAVARPLAEAAPADFAALAGLARCLQSLGYAATAAGRFDDAKPAHEENVALRRRLLAAQPDDPALLDALARSLNLQNSMLLRMAAYPQVRQNADESIGIASRLIALDARNLSYQREYLDGRNQLYIALHALGRLDEAAAGFVDLLAVARKLAAGQESNAIWQRYLGNFLGNAGFVLFKLGRRGDAIAALDEQLAIKRRLVSLDPSNVTWRAELMTALSRTADLFAGEAAGPSAQDLQTALAYYREAAAQARILIARDPGFVTWQFDLILYLARTAKMQMKTGDPSGGRATAREALAEIARLDRSKLDQNQNAIITAIAAVLAQ